MLRWFHESTESYNPNLLSMPPSVPSESISEPGWEDYDAITFEGWIRSHTKHEESRVILRNMCRGMIASEPAQVSFLSIVKSMKGCWSEGDDDQYRLKGGSQAITLQIQKNNLFPIKLNTPVDKIVRDENISWMLQQHYLVKWSLL